MLHEWLSGERSFTQTEFRRLKLVQTGVPVSAGHSVSTDRPSDSRSQLLSSGSGPATAGGHCPVRSASRAIVRRHVYAVQTKYIHAVAKSSGCRSEQTRDDQLVVTLTGKTCASKARLRIAAGRGRQAMWLMSFLGVAVPFGAFWWVLLRPFPPIKVSPKSHGRPVL